MKTYSADSSDTITANYGSDTLLTRVFEYCDKAETAGDTNSAIELFVTILIATDGIRIENGLLTVGEAGRYPDKIWVEKTRQLFELLGYYDEAGTLHPWIIDKFNEVRANGKAMIVGNAATAR